MLRQEFNTVTNLKTVTFKDQIDGHDVFAAQADVTLTGNDSAPSQAVAIVTNKDRQFYTFTVFDLYKLAPTSELQAGLSSVFGAKFD